MLHQEFDADMIVVCLMSMSVYYYYKEVSRSFLCRQVASHYITIFVKRSQCLVDTCMKVIISTSSVICRAFFVAYQIHQLKGTASCEPKVAFLSVLCYIHTVRQRQSLILYPW